MISLVNGYICRSFRDVTDAIQGKEPPAKPGELPYSSSNYRKISVFKEQEVLVQEDQSNSSGSQETNATVTSGSIAAQTGPGVLSVSIDRYA